MTFIEHPLTQGLVVGVVIAVVWLFYLDAKRIRREAVRGPHDTELLDALEGSGWSLQCVRGINGDDDAWCVTDGTSKQAGLVSYTPREALRSALFPEDTAK